MRDCVQADQTRRATTQKSLSTRPRLGEDVDPSARRVVDAERDLEKETLPSAKEAYQHSEAEPEEAKHGLNLYSYDFTASWSFGEPQLLRQ
jgi:hypothetical protein